MKVITRDAYIGLRGPGQQGDDLKLRQKLVERVEQEIPLALEFYELHDDPETIQYARRTYQRWWRRSQPKQTHRMASTAVYRLPVMNDVHHFAISVDGRLFRRRLLLGNDRQHKVEMWLPLDDVYKSRLTNDVIEAYLLWSLQQHR